MSEKPRVVLLDGDDHMHPVEDASNFNESAYYNFFAKDAPGRGGWMRVGNRVNEGYAEVTVVVYEPDGTVGMNYKRPRIENNDAHDAGGVRFEVIKPFEQHHITYSGKTCWFEDPLVLRDPSRAFKSNPFVETEIDIEWEGMSPMWGGEPRVKQPDGSWATAQNHQNQFARGHTEQIGRARGHIEIGGRRYEIDGYGQRDHSWGPRYWQNTGAYQWLIMSFGDMGMMGISTETPDGPRSGGFVWEEGEPLTRIERMDVETEYTGPDRIHDAIRATVHRKGRDPLEITGKVLSVAPLRNRRNGWVTRIAEGMTEWKLGDRVGYGMSEYLEHLEKGE